MQKNILIIGATSGIGKKLAEIYIKENNIVLATGRNIEKLNELKQNYPQNIICSRRSHLTFE
jgi:short-subunit dehydrogenase